MTDPERDRRRRAATTRVLGGFMAGGMLLLAVWHCREAGFSDGARAAFVAEATRIASVWRYRAAVRDRHGNPLNATVDEYALAVWASRLRNLRHTRRQTLDMVEEEVSNLAIDLWPEDAQYRRILREDLDVYMRRASPIPFVLWRHIDRNTLQRWLLVRHRHPSISLMRLPKRIYHLPDLAPLTRGRVFMTREGASGGGGGMDFPDLTMSGWLGVERWRDVMLRGEPGLDTIVLDAVLFRQGTERTREPRLGLPAAMTLDMTLQKWAQEALAGFTGGLVIMQTNGEILAMANVESGTVPLRLDDSYEVWHEALRKRHDSELNRCLADPVGPGSIVKIAVALAALEAGIITPESTFDCTGYVSYSKRVRIRCHRLSGHGLLNLYEAIRSSCNSYFLQLAPQVGWERMADMMWAMGLGQCPGEGLPGPDGSGSVLDDICAKGSVYTPTLKQNLYRKPGDRVWRPIDTGLLAIGQADMRMTVLQAAVYANCIATGFRVCPRILLGEPSVRRQLPVSAATRAVVIQGMQLAVHSVRGTARRARVPGTVLAGKTGTFERGPAGDQAKDVWMLLLYPGKADGTRLVIAAMAHEKESGGKAFGERLATLVKQIKEWETWPEQRRKQWPEQAENGVVVKAME